MAQDDQRCNPVADKPLPTDLACGDRDVSGTRKPLREARHLPPRYYTSQEVLDIEREKIFFRDWLVIGRVEEWPKNGDFRTIEILGESIIVCRNQEGQLRAFANSCRHRGVAVAEGAGNAKEFTCPYHAWTYDLNGCLTAVSRPRGLGHFDTHGCRLPEVRVDTWGGFVFVNFDVNGPSLGGYLDADGYRQAVAYIKPEETVLVDTYTYEIDCNWKLVPENLADIYHVNVIHLATFGGPKYSADAALKEVNYTNHGWNREYLSGTMAPDGELLFGPMPWLAGHPKADRFAFSAMLRPNFYFFARADLIQPWVAYPLSAGRTRVTGWTCLPKEFASLPAFKEKVGILAAFVRKLAAEDFALMEAIQRGFASRYFTRGPMHDLEQMIHFRIQRYLEALES